MAREEALRVEYGREAQRDINDIWFWNARSHGADRATEYVSFLLDRFGILADDPERGHLAPGKSQLRRLTVRKRSGGYGHIAFYRVEGEAVQIVRVLHTSRDWPDLLEDEP